MVDWVGTRVNGSCWWIQIGGGHQLVASGWAAREFIYLMNVLP